MPQVIFYAPGLYRFPGRARSLLARRSDVGTGAARPLLTDWSRPARGARSDDGYSARYPQEGVTQPSCYQPAVPYMKLTPAGSLMSRAMTVFPPAALALCMGQIGTGGPVHGKASAGSNLGPPEVHARYISSLTCKYPPAGRTRSRPTATARGRPCAQGALAWSARPGRRRRRVARSPRRWRCCGGAAPGGRPARRAGARPAACRPCQPSFLR